MPMCPVLNLFCLVLVVQQKLVVLALARCKLLVPGRFLFLLLDLHSLINFEL